jgi:hypothetical protein
MPCTSLHILRIIRYARYHNYDTVIIIRHYAQLIFVRKKRFPILQELSRPKHPFPQELRLDPHMYPRRPSARVNSTNP